MPSVPAFYADVLERRGYPCVVTRVEELSPRFRRVHFSGERLAGHAWEPCQVTSFRVSPTEFRHYTVDSHDARTGTMSVLFHRHASPGTNHSPGEAWFSGLRPGDRAMAAEPGTSRDFKVHPGRRYLICGDATTVGMWASLIRRVGPHTRVGGAVEVPGPDVDTVSALLPGVDVLARGEAPGVVLCDWLERVGPHADHTYLSGHAQTIQRLRRILYRGHGVDRRTIHTHVYWATGKRGL